MYERLNTTYDTLMEDEAVYHVSGVHWWAIQRLGWIAMQDSWTDEKRREYVMKMMYQLYPSLETVCLQIILLNALDQDLSDFTFVAIGIPAPTKPEVKGPEEVDEQPTIAEVPTPTPTSSHQEAAPILEFVDHHLSQVPEASDVVHDLLAFSAEEMLRLSKEKQALEKSFLGYMEKLLCIQPQPDKDGNVGIAAMKNKTQIVNYVGDYQKDGPPLSWKRLSEILTLNKKLCQVEQFDRALFDLEREYHANLDKVLPLKNQLQRTDWLIDQIVYRLYDLTEEEIQAVEDSIAKYR